jgi:hypothetical protein
LSTLSPIFVINKTILTTRIAILAITVGLLLADLLLAIETDQGVSQPGATFIALGADLAKSDAGKREDGELHIWPCSPTGETGEIIFGGGHS